MYTRNAKSSILKAVILAAVVLGSGIAEAQNMTAVSATNIMDLNGSKLALGQICFQATDQQSNPISFQVGGGGQALKRKYCSPVTAGVVGGFSVPNPAATLPTGIYYHVTVTDSSGSSAGPVIDYYGVTFSGGSFNFDSYTPVLSGASFASLTGTSVTGNLGVTGNIAATGTVTGSNIPSSILQQIFSSGVGQTQRTSFNMFAGLTCSDNGSTLKTDCRLGTLTTVTFSATPTFDASTASTFKLTLTGNVTSSTLSNAVAGEPINIEVCQDGTGGRTFVPPTNVQGWVTIPSGANACIMQDLVYDGTNAVASSAGTVEFASPPPLGSTTPNTVAATTLSATGTSTLANVNLGAANTLGTSTVKQVSATTAFTIQDNAGVSHFFISGTSPYTNTFISGNGSGAVMLGSAAKTTVDDATGNISFSGATSGTITLKAPAVAGSNNVTLPAATDTLVGKATTDTLTNKTISGASNTLTLTPNVQRFTASGTFTIPTGVTAVKVTVVGAGGAGGGATTTSSVNGVGGSAGGAAIKWLTGLTPGNTLTVTIGTGGTGVANATGNSGGNTTVASGTQTISTITANGGNGGLVNGQPLSGGTSSGGDMNFSGSPGQTGFSSNVGGNGGAGMFGGGGLAGLAGAGNTAVTPGSGGGGAGGSAGGTVAGGAGANGIVIFEWVN